MACAIPVRVSRGLTSTAVGRTGSNPWSLPLGVVVHLGHLAANKHRKTSDAIRASYLSDGMQSNPADLCRVGHAVHPTSSCRGRALLSHACALRVRARLPARMI